MNQRLDESRRVVEALEAVGLQVESVYDLVNSSTSYPEAIPTLVELLRNGIRDERVAEGVVRALGVKEARGVAAAPLVEEFKRAPSDRWTYKWAIGNALLVVADKSVVGDICGLVSDKRHGRAREMLVQTLGRFKLPEVKQLLMQLLEEDDLTLHVLIALGKLRAVESKDLIARHLDDPRPAVSRAAQKALARLDVGAS